MEEDKKEVNEEKTVDEKENVEEKKEGEGKEEVNTENEGNKEKKVFGRIYGITNKIDCMRYVGQTIKKVSYRFNEHARANSPLGEAIRKHGRENFEVEVLEECYSFDELNEAEKKWIKEWDCKEPNGYNRTDGGDGLLNPAKGTREKLVKASTGNKHSLGRKHTEDEKRRIRESNLGQKRTAETCENIRKVKTGLKATQATKDKMSKSRKGKKFTQEHKDGIAAARRAYWRRVHVAKENLLAAETSANFEKVKNFLTRKPETKAEALPPKKPVEQLALNFE